MWIHHPNYFLSIIDPKGAYGGGDGVGGSHLLVRARFKGDLERAFGEGIIKHVEETPNRDYRFRALVTRDHVAEVISKTLLGLDYKNVKGATRETWRHDAYAACHGIMEREQRRRATGTATGRVEPGRRIIDEVVVPRQRHLVDIDGLMDRRPRAAADEVEERAPVAGKTKHGAKRGRAS